jgi:hypothetical protein
MNIKIKKSVTLFLIVAFVLNILNFTIVYAHDATQDPRITGLYGSETVGWKINLGARKYDSTISGSAHNAHYLDAITYDFDATFTDEFEYLREYFDNAAKLWSNVQFDGMPFLTIRPRNPNTNESPRITVNRFSNQLEHPATFDLTKSNIVTISSRLDDNDPHRRHYHWESPATIRLNTFDLSSTASADLVTGICAHELGHAIGIGDLYTPNNIDKLMYGDIVGRTGHAPTASDIIGAAIVSGFHTDKDHKWLVTAATTDQHIHHITCSLCFLEKIDEPHAFPAGNFTPCPDDPARHFKLCIYCDTKVTYPHNPNACTDCDGDIYVPSDNPLFAINLTKEIMAIPEGVSIKAYTLGAKDANGNVIWKNLRNDSRFNTSILQKRVFNRNNDVSFRISTEPVIPLNNVKAPPPEAIITFTNIKKRPVRPPNNANYEFRADPTGKTNGNWVAATSNTAKSKEQVQYIISIVSNTKNKDIWPDNWASSKSNATDKSIIVPGLYYSTQGTRKQPEDLQPFPIEGIPVDDFGVRNTYFLRIPEAYDDSNDVYMPACTRPGQNHGQIRTRGLEKPTRYRLLTKVFLGLISIEPQIKIKRGTYVLMDNDIAPTLYTSNDTIMLGDYKGDILLWRAATATKPASVKQTITVD